MLGDFLWAFRWLAKNRLFTVAVVAILGLGIGANTAIFSMVDAVLLRPLPYQSSERLVAIDQSSRAGDLEGFRIEEYRRLNERRDLFEKVTAYRKDMITIVNAGVPDQVFALETSSQTFSMLGTPAHLGRTFTQPDDLPGAPNVVVLSDRLWQRLFHSSPSVVGASLTISDQPYTIVGVMPPEFDFPNTSIEMWIQLPADRADDPSVSVMAVSKAGVSLPSLQRALELVAGEWQRRNPKEKAGMRLVVSPWRDDLNSEYRTTLLLVLAAVGLVLLIACANAGGLLLSRAVQRQKEIAVRSALGADFRRVLRQLLVESLVLSVLGGVAGLAAARVTLQVLLRQLVTLPIAIPHMQRVAINGRVLLFSAGLCILLACLCSLAPVVLAAKLDLQAVLRGGKGTASRRSAKLFSVLIASEAAFAVLLLIGSGLLLRSLIRLQRADKGFNPEHVLTMRVPIGTRTDSRSTGKYDTRPRQIEFYRQVLERLQSIPGVKAVSIVNNLPLTGFSTSTIFRKPDGSEGGVATRTIGSQYFAAMGIPLLAGRTFNDGDKSGSPRVAIVNERLAQELYPNQNPIGRPAPTENVPSDMTIVGVVKNSWQGGYDWPVENELYVPYRQFIFAAFLSTIVVRTEGDPTRVADMLRREVWAIDPNQPVLKIEAFDDVISDSIWRPRFSAWILTVLSALALALTAAGVYGVVAYTAALKASDIGIRVALGAGPQRIITGTLRDALIPLCAGVVAGIAAALLMGRLLASILYQTSSTDPVAYTSAAALILGLGIAASIRPAWKAATQDPLAALRIE